MKPRNQGRPSLRRAGLLLLLLLSACSAIASETDDARKQIQGRIAAREFRGALDLLVENVMDLANAPAGSDAAELDRRVADAGKLMSFNVTRLIDAGSAYESDVKALREKLAGMAKTREFALHSRVQVASAMFLDLFLGNPKASFALYDLIPEKSRTSFKVDQYVLNYLWDNRRFGPVSESLWPDAIIDKQLARQKEQGDSLLYPAALRRQHITAVAKVIAAKRARERTAEASALEQRAKQLFTDKELDASIAQAVAYIAAGPEAAEKSK
jgi:hypothetical protein